MNLAKLLGAGKSITGSGKPVSYRADKKVYLPRFVSPKNPFARGEAEATQPDLAAPVATPASSLADGNIGPTALRNNPSTPPGQKTPGPARATQWTRKMNPMAIFREIANGSSKVKAPVQTELSLEKVKVVHNDLTDADIEVVPLKSRPARQTSPGTSAPKPSLADLGQRIFKATAP